MSSFFNQPKAFYTLFMLEIWERFGYQSLSAVLVVYLTSDIMGFSKIDAISIYAAFSALVYAFIVMGGYIGDVILGAKRTIILGLIVLLLGYILLAVNNPHTIYYALSFVCIGTGLFKSNPSSLLSKCYDKDDTGGLTNGFTLFYMAINIGSILGIVIVPTVADAYGYTYGFTIAVFAIIMSIATMVGFSFTMKHISSHAGAKPLNIKYLAIVIIGIVLMVFVVEALLEHLLLAKSIVVLTFCVSLLICIYLIITHHEVSYRTKMILALILMFEAIVYKISYIQMGTSINFFAINNTDHSIFGLTINAAATFQALNPIWIVLLSPILASYYIWSAKRGEYELRVYEKFSIGMMILSFSFIILYTSKYFANDQGILSAYWLVGSYFFQSLGELLISAIGLSMFAQLAPAKLNGFMIGVWWVFLAFASILGGQVAELVEPAGSEHASTVATLINYTNVFLYIGISVFAFSILMFALSPIKKRMLNAS